MGFESMSLARVTGIAVFCCASSLLPRLAGASEPTIVRAYVVGNIAGQVFDASGAPMPATLKLNRSGRPKGETTVKTEADGFFDFGSLQPGTYQLCVETRAHMTFGFVLTVARGRPNGMIAVTPQIPPWGVGGDSCIALREPFPFAKPPGCLSVHPDNTSPPWDSPVVAGADQAAPLGTRLDPMVLRVTDRRGDPVQDHRVTFSVIQGDGVLSVVDTLTDQEGLASTVLTLGSTPGTVTVAARIYRLPARSLTATATP